MTHHDPEQQHTDESQEGQLVKQTPGLDPEPIREEAGPDWPPDTRGDFENADVVRGKTADDEAASDGTWEGSQKGGRA